MTLGTPQQSQAGGVYTSAAASGTTSALYAVWGLDASQVWAVGSSGKVLLRQGGPEQAVARITGRR